MTRSSRRKWILSLTARWLALSLIGWLVYGLTRALWVFVRLGAPAFDWSWYLAVILLLLFLGVQLVWRRPRPQLTLPILAGLLVWAVAGYFGFWQRIRLHPSQAPPIRLSFWAQRDVVEAPEAVLGDLRTAGGRLYITVGGRSFDGESGRALREGLRRLAEHEIDVCLAVVTSDYLSVPVHEQWIANVRGVAAAVKRETMTNVRGLIGDAEQPKDTPMDIWGADRAAFSQAGENLAGLIRWMEETYPDLPVGVTAFWPLYLDGIDGDPDLSVLLRSSVDPPGSWHFRNVMTYSSFFPPSWRAYFVYLAERTMARQHPHDPPSYLIGLLDPGRPGEPILDLDELVRDARLSRAVGAPEVVVFRLNGPVIEKYGEDLVGRLNAAVNETAPGLVVEVPFSRPASMLVYGPLLGDALLDVRGRLGWLPLGWAVWSGFLVGRVGRGKRTPGRRF